MLLCWRINITPSKMIERLCKWRSAGDINHRALYIIKIAMSSIYLDACFSHAVINGRTSVGESFSPRYRNRMSPSSAVFFFLPLASIMHVSDFDRDSARRRHSTCIKGRTDNIACRCCAPRYRNSLSLTWMYLPRCCHEGYDINVFDSAMIKISISIMLNFWKSACALVLWCTIQFPRRNQKLHLMYMKN